ncbi:uncharacterized protein LOC135260911 [Anguilla rostrata]|uniref:uncharacterized protein LOC135260911 n=1 Tax=Anguilla rostrata TaxID=7938 RepID=UPI0030CC6C12
MAERILRSTVAWAMRGLLCACRFLWVSPYNVADRPRKTGPICDSHFENITGPESESRAKRTHQEGRDVLHNQLVKAAGEIQQLKSQLASQRASWEKRFVELQRRQQVLREQLASKTFVRTGVFLKDGPIMEGNFGENQTEVEAESGGYFEGWCEAPSLAAGDRGLQKHRLPW